MTIRDDDTLVKMPTQIDPSAGTQVSKVWWDGEKLMAQPIPLEQLYREPEQPAQQEPVKPSLWELLHAKKPSQDLTVALLLQSKKNFERNFGQHWQADWVYSDLAELLADAHGITGEKK